MKPKKSLIDQYKDLWEGGKEVIKYNPKAGCCISMYVLNQLNGKVTSQEEKDKLIEMIKEFQGIKSRLKPEDTKCQIEEFQQFLNDYFTKLDNEDRHEKVTMKTSQKFRLMISFLDVLATFEPLDEEMQKCKKYCKFKAIDIFKSLKKGEIPKRGGPKEKEEDDNNLGNEIDSLAVNEETQQNKNNFNNQFNNQGMQQNNNMNTGDNFNSQFYNQGKQNQNNFNNNQLEQDIFNYQFGGNNNNQYTPNFKSNNQYGQNNNNNNQFKQYNNYNNQGGYSNQQQQQPQQPQKRDLRKKDSKVTRKAKMDPRFTKPAGKRTQKVTQDPKNPRLKQFDFGKNTISVEVPLKMKTINYFKIIDNIKKNNLDAYKIYVKNKGGDDYVLNMIEDSLEYLSYVEK